MKIWNDEDYVVGRILWKGIGIALVMLILFFVFVGKASAEGPVFDPTTRPTITVVCDRPVAREDGTPLAVGDIARIDFYSSGNGTTWVPAGTSAATACRLTLDAASMDNGQYYYLARAVDTGGRSSADSNIVPFVLTRIQPPRAPVLRLE